MEPSSLVLVGAVVVVILVALVVAGRVSRLGADNLAEQIGRAAGRGARGDDADLSAVAEGRNSSSGPRPAIDGTLPAGRAAPRRCSGPGPAETHAQQVGDTKAHGMTIANGILA